MFKYFGKPNLKYEVLLVILPHCSDVYFGGIKKFFLEGICISISMAKMKNIFLYLNSSVATK